MAVQNGAVYIAWTEESGVNELSYSRDMLTWSTPISIPTGSTVESVTLIANPSILNQLSLGYLSGSGTDANGGSLHYYPTLCTVAVSSADFSYSNATCYTTTQVSQMNFNPSMTWSGSNLYLFQAYRGNSHCLSSFYSNTGSNPWTYWNSGGLCGAQQTSSAPSSVVYNDQLYVAFRSNGGSGFELIGGTVSMYPYYNWKKLSTGGQSMSGGPDLLPITSSQVKSSLLHSSELVNFYVRGGYLYNVYGY